MTIMIIDPDFKNKIQGSDFVILQECKDITCIIDRDLRLTGYNQAWVDFAENNGGKEVLHQYPLGAKICSAGKDPITTYLAHAYKTALQNHEIFEQDYECSSPEHFRLFHLTAYPLTDSIGLVITHHLVKEKPHTDTVVEFSKRFINENGIVTQCANCRKIRDPQNPAIWHWVPSLIKSPLPNISHGLCPPCLVHYYPDIV